MTKEEMRSFLFSLAWSPWSSYHHRKSTEGLMKLGFTSKEIKEELDKFEQIILSPPGPGSPK